MEAENSVVELMAEVERLRAVAEACVRLRLVNAPEGDPAAWLVGDNLGWLCYGCGCVSESAFEFPHSDECPAIALDRALDELGGDA